MNAATQALAPDESPEQASNWLPPEMDRALNGWRPFRPTQPCGKADCRAPTDWSHCAEPKYTVEPCGEDCREETARILQAVHDSEDIRISLHESGHALMVMACGSRVLHVQISGQPFCRWTGSELFEHRIMITLAAEIPDELKTRPTPEEAVVFLEKVRRGTEGSCDRCQIAREMYTGTLSDDTLAQAWSHYWRQCERFFAIPVVRDALDRLAATLREKRMLSGEEVHALVDAEAMKAALNSLSSE